MTLLETDINENVIKTLRRMGIRFKTTGLVYIKVG